MKYKQANHQISRHAGAGLALSYFYIAAILVILVALVNAPFMVADETNHFLRAVQISHGGLIGVKFPDGYAGGLFPSQVLDFSYAFGKMPFDQGVRTGLAQFFSLFHDNWRGLLQEVSLSNTVIYPPQFYLPSAFALFVTRHFHMHLLQCFYIARIFSGLICVSISAIALRVCTPAARPWLLFCLSLPEVIGLYASFSQDGPFIACAALGAALLSRSVGPEGTWRPRTMIAAVIALALFVSAKPPYITAIFLPLVLVARPYLKFTFTAVFLGLAAVLIWCFFGMHPLITPTRLGDISATRQLHNIFAHPGIAPVVIYNTFIVGGWWLVQTCISTISWVDAGMPSWFYWLVCALAAVLAYFYAFELLIHSTWKTILQLLLLVILIGAAGAGATLSTYLTWDEVGRDSVWGVLGRYFTPLLSLLTPGVALVAQGRLSQRITPTLNLALLYGFLPFSGICYIGVLFLRFWWPA